MNSFKNYSLIMDNGSLVDISKSLTKAELCFVQPF